MQQNTHTIQPNTETTNRSRRANCFYGNGLALIGRSKVYFDIPRDFDSAFGVDRGNFGDILKTYFEIESNDKKLARSVASRNRTYFWSIIGDWTLKLDYVKQISVRSDSSANDSTLSGPFIIRPERIKWIQDELQSGSEPLRSAMDKLLAEADKLLDSKPVSVTDNDVIPPSGDIHDYMSFGPYWWPNRIPTTGCPIFEKTA